MTDDLTKKLKEFYFYDGTHELGGDGFFNLRDEEVEQITQAFIDAGWKQVGVAGALMEMQVDRHELVGVNEGPNIPLMTGQEWLSAFRKEMAEVKFKERSLIDSDTFNLALRSAERVTKVTEQ